MKIKVSDYISNKLVEMGITQVFTVTGGGAMHLNDALGHQKGMTCLYNHHEQACAIAAEAYARIYNKIAAVCVTTGPGGTNALTGVLGGWLDSIPMLIISGQVRFDTTARSSGVGIRAMGDQEFDITKVTDNMTKYSEMVIDPKRIRYCLEKAVYLSYSGRPGPAWLDIPIDVQGSYVEVESLVGFCKESYERGESGWENPCDAQIKEDQAGFGEKRQVLPKSVSYETAKLIIEKIRRSERPVLNAGNGIRIGQAQDVFLRVAEKLGIPVVTGWNSQDCIEQEHPLYVGRGGTMGDRPGNFAVQNSDLVFSAGSRLSIRQVGYNYSTWARAAYVIANDIDIEELKKPSLHIDMKIHADVRELFCRIDEVLEQEYKATPENPVFQGGRGILNLNWLETCRMWKKEYPVVLPKHYQGKVDTPVNVYALIKEITVSLKENQITVVGNGSACVVGGQVCEIKKGQRFITNSAVASMGYDLPAAIGAYQAEPSQDLILITGDGSIQMNLQELQTIIHHRMNIKIFVINNGGYHSIRQTQTNYFGEPLVGVGEDSFDLSFPDLEKLSYAYGYPYVSISHMEQLQSGIQEVFDLSGPVICQVFVSRDQVFEPKSAAKRLPDGTMVSPPLEDLSPFLPEEEMERNMLIPRLHE